MASYFKHTIATKKVQNVQKLHSFSCQVSLFLPVDMHILSVLFYVFFSRKGNFMIAFWMLNGWCVKICYPTVNTNQPTTLQCEMKNLQNRCLSLNLGQSWKNVIFFWNCWSKALQKLHEKMNCLVKLKKFHFNHVV